MHDRAAELIHMLRLSPHPEGGAFREIHRSPELVTTANGETRSALTTIYFLLRAGEKSRWHRVAQSEAWHFHEGDPVELVWTDPEFARLERRRLAAPGAGAEPVAVVPGGAWQAARTTGAYSLVGCTVGPGFEFRDWALLAERAEDTQRLRDAFPETAALL